VKRIKQHESAKIIAGNLAFLAGSLFTVPLTVIISPKQLCPLTFLMGGKLRNHSLWLLPAIRIMDRLLMQPVE
jgi:hypothetical protein